MVQKEAEIQQEVRARLGDLHMAPRKIRLVTDMLVHRSVTWARTQLGFVGKKAARPILKLINSAVANATNNYKLDPDKLVIKSFIVNQGPMLKRFKPRAQGRAFPIRRRSSIVEVVLAAGRALPAAKNK